MRRRSKLVIETLPAMMIGVIGFVLLAYGDDDYHSEGIGALLFAIVLLAATAVSYLHRIMYGEDGEYR